MKDKKKYRKTDKMILFSIGFKMITIVTIIVIISLGSITALVSWMFRDDIRLAAEANNYDVNLSSTRETVYIIESIHSDSLTLIRTLNSVGLQSAIAREISDFFFEQNPRVAALFFSVPGQEGELLINRDFFLSREIDASLAGSYRENNTTPLTRAALNETFILNATPHFGSPLLAIFFHWQNGGGAVLFSPENINEALCYGANQSYMINHTGDILVHTDSEIMRNSVNIADREFIRDILESPHQSIRQSLIETDFGITNRDSKKDFLMQIWEKIKDFALPIINKGIDLFCDFFHIDRKQVNQDETEKALMFLAYSKLNRFGCTVITIIEYNTVFEGINATTRRNIYLTGVVLCFSIMLIWFFAKSISVPLKGLAAAARAIEGGTFSIDLKPKGRDEIGVLTTSFHKMCSALNIFGKFTNRDIALQAMRGKIKPGGLPKNATIFFSDIRGFTEKSENFTKVFGDTASDRIVHWLNEYFTQMVECVEKTNGVVDKFIGDAVMAHWGTAFTAGGPQKDAFNAVYAALMMRKALYELNNKRRKGDPGNPPICIGAGLNTGIVTAGQLGSDMRMEYTVIGDPVNLASRIEALNKPMGTDILIGEDTWKLVKNYFITEEMPSVTVKGKENPVRIFAVINFSNIDKGPQTLAEVRNLLGIETPDFSAVDVNKDEKKYAIGGAGGDATGKDKKKE